ncbi:MAG: T9SS type A sorting domain-containing protein [Bacteroidia bacterium]|nr:T9SS type A sorting domain-containing protein [Bacteroidia bacterium]
MNATWEKYEDSISTVLTHYTDQIKATDTLSKPSMYKITVIDNNMGKVEYDQVNIWVQQNIQPLFFVQFQIDSTLYFSNQSEPIDYSTQYLWEFGDGNSSTQLNPIYTFPFFDSSYVVCLSATNRCGTFTVCDTIRVDSSGLIAYSYSKKLDEIGKAQEFGSAQIKREITVQSFPNPIKNEVSIVYDIPQAYEMGEIVLLNYAGQLVQKTNIKNAKGLTKLSLDGQSSGLYIYQVLIDGVYVKTGKLVKE